VLAKHAGGEVHRQAQTQRRNPLAMALFEYKKFRVFRLRSFPL
jgi:hypothetical protein